MFRERAPKGYSKTDWEEINNAKGVKEIIPHYEAVEDVLLKTTKEQKKELEKPRLTEEQKKERAKLEFDINIRIKEQKKKMKDKEKRKKWRENKRKYREKEGLEHREERLKWQREYQRKRKYGDSAVAAAFVMSGQEKIKNSDFLSIINDITGFNFQEKAIKKIVGSLMEEFGADSPIVREGEEYVLNKKSPHYYLFLDLGETFIKKSAEKEKPPENK